MARLNLRLALTCLYICSGAMLLVPQFAMAQTTNVVVVDGNPIISSGTTMLIEGNMILMNNSTVDNSGNISLTGNWENNSGSPGLINQSPGTVTLSGDTQYVEGNYETDFYNLSLSGTGLKLLANDTKVYDSLELGSLQLSTEANTLTVESNDSGIVTNTTGYVRSDAGGTFIRNMVGTGIYLFPVGSNTETRYRPVSLQNIAGAAQTFSVNMLDYDPDNDGFSRTSTDGSMCNINSEYYHVITQLAGNTAVNLSLYYDSAVDGSFHKIAHWNSNDEWQSTGNYSATSSGNLVGITTNSWSNFDLPVFALADRYIQPTISPAGYVNVCHGDSTTLTASSGYVSYLWNTGETSQSITIRTPGDYLVTGNLGNGSDCIAISDTVHVTVQAQVSPTITPQSATTFCQGGNVTLNAGAYDAYLWSTGDTTSSITVDTSGTYAVTVTLTGCQGSVSGATVDVIPHPATPVAYSNSTVCNGATLELSADTISGASYSWTGPNGFTSAEQDPSITNVAVADSGIYSVVMTVNGCSSLLPGTTDVEVAAHLSTPPFISTNGNILTSSINNDEQWYLNDNPISGATNATYTISQGGWYSVAVTYPGYCITFSDSIYLNPLAIKSVSLDESVKVLPNPFSSQFILDISSSVSNLNKWSVNITDVLGKEVYVSSALQNNNLIDLGNQASGVYFVTINTPTERKTFRMVKQQ